MTIQKQEFRLDGAPHGVNVVVTGALYGQGRGRSDAQRLLAADSPPGGADSVVIYPLPSTERSHAAVAAAVAAVRPVPPEAQKGEIRIAGKTYPAWHLAELGGLGRPVGHLWLGIWPEDATSPGIVLTRSRDIGTTDEALAFFQQCPVVQSIRVESVDDQGPTG
jgi:hypothetical protein